MSVITSRSDSASVAPSVLATCEITARSTAYCPASSFSADSFCRLVGVTAVTSKPRLNGSAMFAATTSSKVPPSAKVCWTTISVKGEMLGVGLSSMLVTARNSGPSRVSPVASSIKVPPEQEISTLPVASTPIKSA